MVTPLTFNTPLQVHSTSQCIITTQWHERIITQRVHTLVHKGETLSKVPRRNSHSPGCGERGWGLTQKYTQNIQSHHMARWGHSVLGALLRWCPYLSGGDVLITVLLHQVKTLKGGLQQRPHLYTAQIWAPVTFGHCEEASLSWGAPLAGNTVCWPRGCTCLTSLTKVCMTGVTVPQCVYDGQHLTKVHTWQLPGWGMKIRTQKSQ